MNDIRYLTDHYDEKIARIKEIGAPLNFVFFTDAHNRLNHGGTGRAADSTAPYELAKNHIASIQYILDRCPGICCVVNGGDIGNDYDHDPKAIRDSYKEVMDAFYALSVPVHNCIGNHDDAITISTLRGDKNTDYAVLPEEMHALCMKYNPTDENYYYWDVPGADYRFVFMNSCDRPYYIDKNGEYSFDPQLEISGPQVKWLEKDALATDRKVIVFSHAPLHNACIFGTGPSYSPVRSHDDTFNGPLAYDIIKNCKNVIAMVHGHVHHDNLVYRDSMVTITTLCSFVQEWAPSCPKRVFGDITETAFDVFSITDKAIYMTRFGAGCDRVATLLR